MNRIAKRIRQWLCRWLEIDRDRDEHRILRNRVAALEEQGLVGVDLRVLGDPTVIIVASPLYGGFVKIITTRIDHPRDLQEMVGQLKRTYGIGNRQYIDGPQHVTFRNWPRRRT